MDPIIYSFRLKIYPSLCMSSHTHKPNMNEKVHVSLRIQKKTFYQIGIRINTSEDFGEPPIICLLSHG